MITQAPIAFITACLVITALMYLFFRWQYGDVIKNNRALIDALQGRVNLQAVAATPTHIEPQPTPPKNHDKIQFAQPKIIHAHREEDHVLYEGRKDEMIAVVVEVTNSLITPQMAVNPILGIGARLFFREVGGFQKLDVALGSWVGTNLTYIDFPVGRSMLLVIATENSLGTAAIENDYVLPEEYGAELYDPKFTELTGKSYDVIVQLVSGPNYELISQFDLRLTAKPLTIKPLATPSASKRAE